MRYGISTGSIIIQRRQLVLVHHREEGKYDFWVPPGSRLEGNESIFDCVIRETWEETGLEVKPQTVAYIQEFLDGDYHFVKFFILCKIINGELTLANKPAGEDFLVDVKCFAQAALLGLHVFPEILLGKFWQDLKIGFPEARYLGLETITEF